jgi:hypothetical protein
MRSTVDSLDLRRCVVRIQPRQQIFEVWKALLRNSWQDGRWLWGGVHGSNAISDAEQLLCLLYPATEIDSLSIDRPDDTDADVQRILSPLGDTLEIPWRVIKIIQDYIKRYTDKSGQPIFAGGSYLHPADGLRSTEGRRRGAPAATQTGIDDLDVLDAYSMSVTLCLAALGFMKKYREEVGRGTSVDTEIDELWEAISRRLTAAMVGLRRGFVVRWFKPADPEGRALLAMVNRGHEPERVVLERLRERLLRTRLRLRDDIGAEMPPGAAPGSEPELFECGWSWGVARGAGPVDVPGLEIATRAGLADGRPYLYFTVVALDGINDLTSPRTRELNLLDEYQRRLADDLHTRWDLTQRYWSTIARFGSGKWTLEDVPWRTSDGMESEYYTLLVSAVLVQDLYYRTAEVDVDLSRVVVVREELARRGRITQRVYRGDPATALHDPGLLMPLIGSERDRDEGHRIRWRVADYAPLLMKRSLQAASLADTVADRDALMQVAGAAWQHLMDRRLRRGRADGLWDDQAELLGLDRPAEVKEPSWYLTERVVEGLIEASRLYKARPLRSPAVAERTLDLLTEADHLFNAMMLEVDVDDRSRRAEDLIGIARRLDRAREIIDEYPGTANVLASEALLELDRLAVAKNDAGGRR